MKAKQGAGFFDEDAAERIGFTRRTVEQIRERFVTEGLAAALERKKRSRNRLHKLDGDGEARLVSLDPEKPIRVDR